MHGPVLSEDLGKYLGLYDLWSSYTPEEKGVVIAYASVYGNTKRAAESLAAELKEKGVENVALFDLARCDMSEAVAYAFRYSAVVFASLTYNGDVFPFMRTFIESLTERNFRKRTVGFIENGSWAPMATKAMKKMLENCKDLAFLETSVTVKSAIGTESEAQIEAMAEELCSLPA